MRYCPTCGARFSNEVRFCPHDGVGTLEIDEAVGEEKDPLIGQVVEGRYRLEKPIGEGGMGIVYLATHTVLNKKLAIKVLRGDSSKDEGVVERFVQEARAATSIGHENIIDISDFGSLPDGTAYFVMEHLDGQPLSDMVAKGGAVPNHDAIQIVIQIASALGAAHQRGIVHRDLKPDNVFLIARGQNPLFVKVLDFGIAKVGGAGSKLTKTGMVFGTPHYMSPEQAAGQPVDSRTDIYALGVIMYEMFTGRVPFDADTFMGILSKHMFEPPTPPSQGNAELGALESVILRALSKKPEDRYQTMQEMVEDIETVVRGGSVRPSRSTLAAGAGLADALEPPSNSERPGLNTTSLNLPKNRAPLFLGLVALLLLGGGAVGAAYALGAFAPPEPEPPTMIPEPVPFEPIDDAQTDTPPTDATVEEEAETPPRLVEIRTRPEGAQVVVDGAIVGNTPVTLPLPAGEASRDVEIRLRDHGPEMVRLTAASPESIVIALERSRPEVRPTMRPTMVTPTAMVDPVMMDSTPMQAPMQPPMQTPMMVRMYSEVLDPWAR
ncbi:MAG: serine/threonine-protein kinase [Myxococcota bacterium]